MSRTKQEDRQESICQKADRLVSGDRAKSYGPSRENFGRIAAIWSAILDTQVTMEDVALCMMGLKIAREVHLHSEDNLIDIAGYAQLAGVLSQLTDKDGGNNWPKMRYTENKDESSKTYDEAMASEEQAERGTATNEAKKFLREILKDGPLPATQIKREAEENGITDKPLRTASNRLNIDKKKKGYSKYSFSEWSLPLIIKENNETSR